MKEFYDISNNQIPKLQKRKQEINKIKTIKYNIVIGIDLKDELKEIRSKIKKLKKKKIFIRKFRIYI